MGTCFGLRRQIGNLVRQIGKLLSLNVIYCLHNRAFNKQFTILSQFESWKSGVFVVLVAHCISTIYQLSATKRENVCLIALHRFATNQEPSVILLHFTAHSNKFILTRHYSYSLTPFFSVSRI